MVGPFGLVSSLPLKSPIGGVVNQDIIIIIILLQRGQMRVSGLTFAYPQKKKKIQSSFCRLRKALSKNAILQGSMDYRAGILHCILRSRMDQSNLLLFH